MSRALFEVGINDVDYVVVKRRPSVYVNGIRKQERLWTCPYYQKWSDMLRRCYCKKSQNKRPTYIGCTVTPEWFYLSNFIRWVDSQPNRDWENCQLDKDLLIEGNKCYSPDSCAFVSKGLNLFIINSEAHRGGYLIGVSYHKATGRLIAQCRDPFKVKTKYIGSFNTEMEAHKAWQARKHEYALQLADLQNDPRVAEVLRTKYAPDKDWAKKDLSSIKFLIR
jgi:hypothetical protein